MKAKLVTNEGGGLREWINERIEHPTIAAFMDGFDDCLIGMVNGYPCYSRVRVVESLMRQGMSTEEAWEYNCFSQVAIPYWVFLDTPD